MKIDVAVFKLIDNDTKTVQKICVKVICNHKAEWDEVDMLHYEYHNLSVEHKAWLIKSGEWKHALKETILNMMKKQYPHIKDFTLEKVEDKKECHKINMSSAKPTDNKMHMMEVSSMEKCILTYSKGQAPSAWKDMFKYNCTFYEHVFEANLGAKQDINNIELKPLATYNIMGNVEKVSVTQKGGYDTEAYEKEKYEKYKYKYNELKKKSKRD